MTGKIMIKYVHFSLRLSLVCMLSFFNIHPVAASTVSGYEELQILKGDVYTIPTKNLKRVSITDPNIADITDAKPEEVIVVGQQAGQTVVFIWDDSGKRSFLVQVVLEDLGVLKAKIKTVLENANIKGVVVQENSLEGKVLMTGYVPEARLQEVNTLADTYVGMVQNLVKKEEVEDMIQLDMQITELSTTLTKELGVAWNSSFTHGETLPGTTIGNIPDFFQIGDITRSTALEAKINALITEGKGHILSKPRIVVKNGKEATFLVGGEIPIKTTTTSASGGASQENVTFKSYGVSMGVTPTIKESKIDVTLNVEISDIDAANANKSGDMAFVTRSAQTQLFLDDKQTIVMAGLIKKRNDRVVSRVPVLSKIPLVGALFRNSSEPTGNGETEVVISITPTIIKVKKQMPVVDVKPIVKAAEPTMTAEAKFEMSTGRNGSKLPVITKNAASVDVQVAGNLKEYAQVIQQKISSTIAYPYEAQQNRWQGTVKIGMVIRKDGSLREIYLKESSGYDVFDQDAINTAKMLAPYTAFPASIEKDEIAVTLPIVYSLEAFLKNVAKHK